MNDMSSGKTIGLIKAVGGAGGGGTSDAVQYIPQELTTEQQMQARKNLGVYWKGETEIATIPPEYLPNEEWTFTLEDGSTVTKKVVISE